MDKQLVDLEEDLDKQIVSTQDAVKQMSKKVVDGFYESNTYHSDRLTDMGMSQN